MRMRVRSFWEVWDGRSWLGWRALLSKRPTGHNFGTGHYQTLEVYTTKNLETLLKPVIKQIVWYRVGSEMATVVVSGENFFAGTTLILGDTVLKAVDAGFPLARQSAEQMAVYPATGRLTIKSAETLEFNAPLIALLNDALLSGRYGRPEPLKVDCPKKVPEFKISEAWIDSKPEKDSYIVRMEFRALDNSDLDCDEFVKLPAPIVAINGKVVPDVLLFYPTDYNVGQRKIKSISARVAVKPELIKQSPVLVVRWPFYCGERWLLHCIPSFSSSPLSKSASGPRLRCCRRRFLP
jgi:hypothetical protein